MLERDTDADADLGERIPYPLPQDDDATLQQWLAELQIEVDDVDVALDNVLNSLQVEHAPTQALDELGKDFGELGKRRGRDDDQYRSFLLALVAAFDGRGTPPGVKTAIAVGVLASVDDVSLIEDFDSQEYEVVLENEAWSAHQSGTVRELADLSDPSTVEFREPVHNRIDPATITITTGETVVAVMHRSAAGTVRLVGDDTEHDTVNSADTFGTGRFDGKNTFS
jgi:hypothetical protein